MYMYILHVYKWVVNDNINGRGHASREAERLIIIIITDIYIPDVYNYNGSY